MQEIIRPSSAGFNTFRQDAILRGSMLLDLNKIHAPRERYEKVYPPGAFPADGEAFRVVEPVSLAFDILKDKQHFQLTGAVATMLELPCSRSGKSKRTISRRRSMTMTRSISVN
jgi:hypothetical protein